MVLLLPRQQLYLFGDVEENGKFFNTGVKSESTRHVRGGFKVDRVFRVVKVGHALGE